MSIAAHGRNVKVSKSQYAEGRNHRREVKIREYLQKQPDGRSGAPASETAVHVVQELGLYVSDKRAHEWWCSLFDMITDGTVIEEEGGWSVRLATADELRAKLEAEPGNDKLVTGIALDLNMKERSK